MLTNSCGSFVLQYFLKEMEGIKKYGLKLSFSVCVNINNVRCLSCQEGPVHVYANAYIAHNIIARTKKNYYI